MAENVASKSEVILKDSMPKIEQILQKIKDDYNNSLIDPTSLDELRRTLKVSSCSWDFVVLFEKEQVDCRYSAGIWRRVDLQEVVTDRRQRHQMFDFESNQTLFGSVSVFG